VSEVIRKSEKTETYRYRVRPVDLLLSKPRDSPQPGRILSFRMRCCNKREYWLKMQVEKVVRLISLVFLPNYDNVIVTSGREVVTVWRPPDAQHVAYSPQKGD